MPSHLTAWPSRDLIRAGHQQITKEWWQTRRAEFDIYISQFVLDEAAAGDAEAARERMAALQGLPLLDLRVCQQITFTSNNAQARNMATRDGVVWIASGSFVSFVIFCRIFMADWHPAGSGDGCHQPT